MAKFESKYDAISMIMRNGGSVDTDRKQIMIKKAGLKVLSAVDYLVNYHRFWWISE